MQMTEILDKLKSLQDVLAEKYEIEAKKEELPKSLDGSVEGLTRFKKEYIENNAEYEAEKSKVQSLKVELDEAQRARENGEKGMDAITTHREYELLDKQINEAKLKEEEIRKQLQREEKIFAEQQERLNASEIVIAQMEGDVQEARESLEREMNGLQEKLDSLAEQEKEMSEGIDVETIFKFQRIIQRNRKGIVAVKGNVCDGCHMILPAQFANDVHKGEKILFCPYCSRILFYEETDDSESSYFTMDDAGSLVDDDESFAGFDDDEYAEDEYSDDETDSESDDVGSSLDYE